MFKQNFNRSSVLAAALVLALSACQPVNASISAQVRPAPAVDAQLAGSGGKSTAVIAGGCFWGVSGVFSHVKGVQSVLAGYSGGSADTAHYEMVSGGQTGQAESVQITYNPSQISYGKILQIFFSVAFNPTELNRQGPDSGSQYRSVLFYNSPEQQKIASGYIDQLTAAHSYSNPIVTRVVPLTAFYPAEDYHQDYAELHPDNPYIAINDEPMIEHLKGLFPDLYHR
jgi:peptide-methionine (S)-S-oxide reductase